MTFLVSILRSCRRGRRRFLSHDPCWCGAVMGQMKGSRAAVEIDFQRKHFPAAAGEEGQPAAPCGACSWGWGQVWRGNRCSYRGWIQRHHRSHGKVLLTQAGLRQYIQFNLPNCFDQSCFYIPGHRSLGDLVLPTSFGFRFWRGRPLLFATAIHTLMQELRAGPLDLA